MQLYKRGKYFWVRFTVNGKQYREGTKEVTKAAAGTRATEIINRVQGGKPRAAIHGAPTLAEFAGGWFTEWVKSNARLAFKSREYYLYGLLLLRNQKIMSMRIDAISAEDADMIRVAGSPSTHNTALRTLRRMLNLAAKRGLVSKAPAISLLEESRRTLLVEPDAEQRIADELTRPGRRRGSLKTALYMILDAGMRPKEICSMRIEDVNFDRGFVYVPKSKTRAGARFLALTDRMKEKLFAQIGARTEGYVFPSPRFDGSPIKSQALTAAWRKACKAAGVSPDLKLYCARHTFGTDAMSASKNPFVVMKAMGHTELRTTERYQHHDILELGAQMNERNRKRAVN